MEIEQEASYEGEVIETYVPDDSSISEFHSSSLDKKLRVIKLGLFFIFQAIAGACETVKIWR